MLRILLPPAVILLAGFIHFAWGSTGSAFALGGGSLPLSASWPHSDGEISPIPAPPADPRASGPSGDVRRLASVAAGSVSERRETFLCSNCEEEIEYEGGSSLRCPHCGILLEVEGEAPTDATSGKRSPDDLSVGSRPVNAPSGESPIPAPRTETIGRTDDAAHRNVPRPPEQASGPPADLSEVPLWGKLSLFFGCLAALYYVLFTRR